MTGGKPKPTINLGIFIPSTFLDKDWIYNLLDARIESINTIVSLDCGCNFAEQWAVDRNVARVIYPINKQWNLLKGTSRVLELSDKICIIDNHHSSSLPKILLECKKAKKDYKVVQHLDDDQLQIKQLLDSIVKDKTPQDYKKWANELREKVYGE